MHDVLTRIENRVRTQTLRNNVDGLRKNLHLQTDPDLFFQTYGADSSRWLPEHSNKPPCSFRIREVSVLAERDCLMPECAIAFTPRIQSVPHVRHLCGIRSLFPTEPDGQPEWIGHACMECVQ